VAAVASGVIPYKPLAPRTANSTLFGSDLAGAFKNAVNHGSAEQFPVGKGISRGATRGHRFTWTLPTEGYPGIPGRARHRHLPSWERREQPEPEEGHDLPYVLKFLEKLGLR
jgi:hypothetical protein